MPNCSSLGCTGKGGHQFPEDKSLRMKWRVAVSRATKTKGLWNPGPAARICSKHFKLDDYKNTLSGRRNLKRNAVPSIFTFAKPSKKCPRSRRLSELKVDPNSQSVENEKITFLDELDIQREEEVDMVESHEEINISDAEMADSRSRSLVIQNQNAQRRALECLTLLELYKSNDDANKYYTSFDDYRHFKFFFDILGHAASNLTYQCAKLTPQDQLFLTLMKIRQAKDDFELSLLFHISESTVRTVIYVWISCMYAQLKELDIWPSSDVVEQHMPRDFKAKFPRTRVILDATEIPIAKPSNLILQSATFSSYKNTNTLKTIIGCTPSGLVSFISDTYGGRSSDRQIIERSTLVKSDGIFMPGDSIMADRGIMVQDLFASKAVFVNTPRILKGKTQFSPIEVVCDRRIASKRVHIERIIGLGKTFKILTRKLDASKRTIAHKIVFVCFVMSNFRNRIISNYA